MKLSVEGYLGTAAFLVAFGLPSCTVETSTSGLGVASSAATTGSAGSSSSSSSTMSTSSTSGSGGASAATTSGAGGSGTGGAGGTGGGDNDASSDGGAVTDAAQSDATSVACFADDPDGGDASTSPCSALPYYATVCTDDAGSGQSLGAFICDDLTDDLKTAAFRELFDCLMAAPGGDGGADACSAAHDAAASECSKNIFNRSTCAVPDGNVDGGAYGCAQIAASCPSDGGTGGITVAQCQAWLAPFNATARQGIIECYLDPATPAGSSCADTFEGCVF